MMKEIKRVNLYTIIVIMMLSITALLFKGVNIENSLALDETSSVETSSQSSDITSIIVKPTNWKSAIGDQKRLTAAVNGGASTGLTWTSSDDSKASVDSNGKVTAKARGTVTITATAPNGVKGEATIEVVGSDITSEIVNAMRKSNATLLKNSTNTKVKRDQDELDEQTGTYKDYPLGLGCGIEEDCNFEEVKYEEKVTESQDGKSIDTIKNEWNSNTLNPNRWNENGMDSGEVSLAYDSIKGKYAATYKKAGKYGTSDVDIKVTVMDFEITQYDNENYMVSDPAITLRKDRIGISVTGVKWVKLKFEFFDNATGESIRVKGNTTYWDIDQNQGIIINNDDTNYRIYYSNGGVKYKNSDKETETKDNQLYAEEINSGMYIFDKDSGVKDLKPDPLYNDILNSTAYAVTELFEGTSITRTFQFSNPIYTNWQEEFVWNGHGGMHLSDTHIESKQQYIITTYVENGTIDPEKPLTVYEGDDATVKYSPKEGYTLKSIKVDGESKDLKTYATEYKFTNIDKDHHVEVIYEVGSAKTGLFEVGGILLLVLATALVAYSLTRKKEIASI